MGFPFAISVDGPRLNADTLAIHPVRLAFLLAAVGVTYFLFNFAALKLLERLDVISHAVCNLGKRIFVIGTSIAFFNNPLTIRAVIGTLMTIAGSGLYSNVKAKSKKKPKQGEQHVLPSILTNQATIVACCSPCCTPKAIKPSAVFFPKDIDEEVNV